MVETNERVFERKMEKPQRAALKEDWKAFKQFFEENKNALLEPMDLDKNTAFHVATRSNKPHLLAELLVMLPISDRRSALRQKNACSCTVLHHATLFTDDVQVVDVWLGYEEEEPLALLKMKNDLGETPLYMAAKEGNIKMVQHMTNFVRVAAEKGIIKMVQHMTNFVREFQFHCIRDSDKLPILHVAIIGQHFGIEHYLYFCGGDVAIWLMKVDDELGLGLGEVKDEKGLTALQLLSKMPFVFRSCSPMGTTMSLLLQLQI
ncbi:hypothetical protein CR513_36698, partial [Mucuna pruriens]